jgi:hypothetical protein
VASAQIGEVMHALAAHHLAQTLAGRREESAERPAAAQFFEPGPPALGTAADPLEKSGRLARDRCLTGSKTAPKRSTPPRYRAWPLGRKRPKTSS